jgi:hypothetical protein
MVTMMDPGDVGRGAGGLLGGIAKLIMALRGRSPHFEVEATHYPEKLELPCTDCDRAIEDGHPEQVFVQVHALTSGHYRRVRAAGLCRGNWLTRKLRRHKATWHETAIKPVGGIPTTSSDSMRFDPEMLRRFGRRRDLPTTVKPDDPLCFNITIPADLPKGIKRGRKLRAWVGKPLKGGLVSDPIVLPKLTPQEPPTPRRCSSCEFRLNRPAHPRPHHHDVPKQSSPKPVDEGLDSVEG